MRRARAIALALAAAAVAAAPGCAGPEVIAAAIDYRAGVRVVRIEQFDDPSRAKVESPLVYNLRHEEGRKAAARARMHDPKAHFTYALAHNVALRIRESEEAFRAAGLAPPIVLVVTRAYPRGIVATGAGPFSSAFDHAPSELPGPEVRVRGGIRYDVAESEIAAEGGAAARRVPAYAWFDVEGPASGATEQYAIAYADKDAQDRAGVDFPDDPGAQMVARLADFLSPHELRLKPAGAPLMFVRRAVEARTIECDVGLERRSLHVRAIAGRVELPARRDEMDARLVGRYVRIRFREGPEPPSSPLWPTVEVEERE